MEEDYNCKKCDRYIPYEVRNIVQDQNNCVRHLANNKTCPAESVEKLDHEPIDSYEICELTGNRQGACFNLAFNKPVYGSEFILSEDELRFLLDKITNTDSPPEDKTA